MTGVVGIDVGGTFIGTYLSLGRSATSGVEA